MHRIVVALFAVMSACGLAAAASAKEPVRIIFDTDIMSDVDDVGAVAVLHALANRGECQILAMGVSVDHPSSALCLDALNTYFGRPEIPLGVVKTAAHQGKSKYADQIAKEFPHRLKSVQDAPDVLSVYRETLAKQPDESVMIISVGQLTNLRNLLKSAPDKLSPLAGRELVKQKVAWWVCMGGKFPAGKEYNLFSDAPAALETINNWPTPITFSGWEIGKEIVTGAAQKAAPANSPVRRAYDLYNGLKGRESWDQTAVLYAVREFGAEPGPIWELISGTIKLKEDASNEWSTGNDSNSDSPHAYLVEKMPPAKVAAMIDQLMLERPKTSPADQ